MNPSNVNPSQVNPSKIYKVLPRGLWAKAESRGQFSGAAIDLEDGYIHFSTAHQLTETVQKHFHGQPGLVIVEVHTTALGGKLKWEPSRGGALFPHLYGDLPVTAATRTLDLPINDDGSHQIPDELLPR